MKLGNVSQQPHRSQVTAAIKTLHVTLDKTITREEMEDKTSISLSAAKSKITLFTYLDQRDSFSFKEALRHLNGLSIVIERG